MIAPIFETKSMGNSIAIFKVFFQEFYLNFFTNVPLFKKQLLFLKSQLGACLKIIFTEERKQIPQELHVSEIE